MLLIFILLTLCPAEIIFTKFYTKIHGQSVISDFSLSKINFQTGQQLIITISDYDSNNTPLLMVCDTQPKFQQQPDLSDLQDNACLADLNSFDLQFDWQNIVLVYNQQHQKTFMNIMQTFSTRLILLVYADIESDFMVTIRFRDEKECFPKCQNAGICRNGICECQQNYLGFDCSLEILEGVGISTFFPGNIYSFDISMKNELTLAFNTYFRFSFICLTDNPYLLRGQTLNMNALSISPSQSLQCQQSTDKINQLFQFNLVAQYIFVPQSQADLLQSSSSDTTQKTTIYATSTIGAVVIFVGIYCCLKCRKAPTLHIETMPLDRRIALAKQINKFMPPQKYQDIVHKFPGLAEENICQICLENFEANLTVRMTYCTHIFHVECIDAWINRNEICPTCRSALNVETYNKIEKTENDDFIIGGGGSTKQILGEHSQRQIRLFGNQRVSGSPIICISQQEK